MRILFDQATPVPIRKFLKEHSVRTAYEQGWDTLENGALIQAAEDAGFDLFLTVDQNIAYQQNLEGRKIAIVIIALGNWTKIEPHIERVVLAINNATNGSFSKVE